MADTIPVIWGQTSDGKDAYVKTCTKGVYNPATGKTIDKELVTMQDSPAAITGETPIKPVCDASGNVICPQTRTEAVYDAESGQTLDKVIHPMYSTEEQWTGEYWIDGKKIWKRTYPFIISAINTSVFVDLGVQVDVSPRLPDAFVESEDGSFRFFPGINGSSASGGNLITVFGNRAASHKNTLNIATNAQTLVGRQGYATVYYTKVTE